MLWRELEKSHEVGRGGVGGWGGSGDGGALGGNWREGMEVDMIKIDCAYVCDFSG